jgi:hypothetical protein
MENEKRLQVLAIHTFISLFPAALDIFDSYK